MLAQAGIEALQRLFLKFDTIRQSEDGSWFEVNPGSVLADDCAATEYDPLAAQVGHLVASADDHLGTLRDFVKLSEGQIPPFAGYTLIRSSIEASASAVWLLSGGSKDKRILRSLQYVVRSRRDVEPLSRKLGMNNDAGAERMRAQLEELKARRPGLNQRSLDRFPTTTDILIESDRKVKTRSLSGLDTWRACSGLAHSNKYSALMLLQHEQRDQVGTESPTHRITSSWSLLSMMFEVALDYLQAVLRMYAEHNKP